MGDVFFSPKKDLGLELQSVSGFANQKKNALFLFKPHWRQNAYSGILIFDIWYIRVFCWANIQQTSVMPGSTKWMDNVAFPKVWDHNITLCFWGEKTCHFYFDKPGVDATPMVRCLLYKHGLKSPAIYSISTENIHLITTIFKLIQVSLPCCIAWAAMVYANMRL